MSLPFQRNLLVGIFSTDPPPPTIPSPSLKDTQATGETPLSLEAETREAWPGVASKPELKFPEPP